jgi:hypothetical protein
MAEGFEFNHLAVLKQRLEEETGIRLFDFKDCTQLSLLLSREKIIVSAHTIARTFGILKKHHIPYRSTLNLMVSFLGFSTYEQFCQTESHLLKQRLKGKHNFNTGDFSFTAFELAVSQSSWKDVHLLLEAYQTDFRKQSFTDYLGITVRNHPDQKEFLKTLADTKQGRLLFYESFVDEDDPNNYYSEALVHFYMNKKTDFGSRFFIESFITAKKIYANSPVNNLSEIKELHESFNAEDLHFHHLSRWFELRILLGARAGKPFGEIAEILFEMLEKIKMYHPYDRRWILARSIKAIVHSGYWSKSFQLETLKNELLFCYQSLEGQVNAVADLIIQLCAHRLWIGERFLCPVITLKESYQSESQLKMAIEGATSLLYAKDPINKILFKTLKPFAHKTGNSWVLHLI